jgi:hypothetical protein
MTLPALGRLDPSAGIRIGDDLAVELDGGGQIADCARLGAYPELALHRLGHEQAAVGQPAAVGHCRSMRQCRTVGATAWLYFVIAMILVTVRQRAVGEERQDCGGQQRGLFWFSFLKSP